MKLSHFHIALITVSLLLLILLLSGCSPKVPLDTMDKVLIGTMLGGQALDYSSTVDGLDRGCSELNPILGDDPSKEQLLAFKVGASALFITMAYIIDDSKWRKIWLGFATVIGVGAGIHNYNVDCN